MCFSRSFLRSAILLFSPSTAAIFSFILLIFSRSSSPLLDSCLPFLCLCSSSSSSSLFLTSSCWSRMIFSLISLNSRIFSSRTSFRSAQYSSILPIELFFSRYTFSFMLSEQFSLSSKRCLPKGSAETRMLSRDMFLLLWSPGNSNSSVSSRANSLVRWEKYLLRSGKGALVAEGCEVSRRRLLNRFILASTSSRVFCAFSRPRRVSSCSPSEPSIQNTNAVIIMDHQKDIFITKPQADALFLPAKRPHLPEPVAVIWARSSCRSFR